MTQSRRATFAWALILTAVCLFGALALLCEASARNTALVAAGSCIVAVSLGTLLAFLLARTDLPARRLWLCVFVVLLFVPLYLQAAGWDAGFGRMGWQGGPGQAQWFDGARAAIWIHGAAGIPWVILIVMAGLRSVNSDSEEAALLAGTNWQVLRHVTFHRVTGAIVLACLWVFVTTATESVVTDLYMVDTFARKLFLASTGLDQGLYATEVALGVLAISGCVLVGLILLIRLSDRESSSPIQRSRRFSMGRCRHLSFVVMAGVITATVAVPIANLILQAGEESHADGTTLVRTWSLARFGETVDVTVRRFSNAIRWTVIISTSAATLSCLISLPLAWLARRGGIRSLPAMFAVLVGLAVPAPLIAEAVIWLLNRDTPPILGQLYDRSILAPTLTVVVRALPAVTIVMWFALQSIASEQLDTAEMDGAGGLRRLYSIAVPQRAAALAVAWLVGFAIAAGDVTASILVMPPGIETVAVRVFELLHAGVDEQVAGLCLVSAAGYLLLGSIIFLFIRRWIGENGAESKRVTGL